MKYPKRDFRTLAKLKNWCGKLLVVVHVKTSMRCAQAPLRYVIFHQDDYLINKPRTTTFHPQDNITSMQEYDHSYGLVDDLTPTSTPRGTPLSSPSKARLLRPKFLN